MYKTITLIYIALYGCFVLFARQPDCFDGEVTNATIRMVKDSATNALKPVATFSVGANKYVVATIYPLRFVKEGDALKVIYESSNPKKAVVYSVWGYWILWDELLVSSVIYLVLFQVAVGITSNPTPEALMEQLEYKSKPKTRYTE